MKFKDESEFSKAYKAGQIGGLILLCGTEDYLISSWKKKLLAPFGGDEGFNLQFFDGTHLDLDAVFDATQMLPVFASEKCVLLSDLDPAKLNAADQKKLEEIFSQLPPECLFLITSRPPAYQPKNASSKKLFALAEKHGSVLELLARDKASMVRFIQSLAKDNGSTISTELSRYILELCESDMQSLIGEVSKIANYAKGEIAKEHIDAIASPKTEAKVFDLSKAITAGSADKAMHILKDLFYMRENPVAINATLIMSYVDLYRGRVGKDCGLAANDLVVPFGYRGREFRIRNAYSTKISTESTRRSLDILYKCEKQLKGSGLNSEMVLEKTVLALLACRNS